MTYGTPQDNQGHAQWYLAVKDPNNGDFPITFVADQPDSTMVTKAQAEALFQKIITVLDADTDLVVESASRVYATNQNVTP